MARQFRSMPRIPTQETCVSFGPVPAHTLREVGHQRVAPADRGAGCLGK